MSRPDALAGTSLKDLTWTDHGASEKLQPPMEPPALIPATKGNHTATPKATDVTTAPIGLVATRSPRSSE